MYKVLLAVKSNPILQELKNLHIWGGVTEFEICEVTPDFDHLIEKLKEERYHLIFLEALPENHVLSILRVIKKEKLCKAVAIVSQNPEFKIVRKSFLLGVDDYLAVHFAHIDDGFKGYLDELLYTVLSEYIDLSESFKYLQRIISSVLTELFEQYKWLKHYFNLEDYIPREEEDSDYEEMIKKSIDNFYAFFLEFAELYPAYSEEVKKILLYILERPDNDLRQKTIAEELYMNRSYMSTIFAAQVGRNFVEYINIVKMKRAVYLLKNTDMKVIDIAGVLNYKDMGYFLKKFKAKYGFTPSQYRVLESYDFQI